MKMSQLKMVIREVVREEIQLGLKEVIGEMNQPTKKASNPQPKIEEVVNEKKQCLERLYYPDKHRGGPVPAN